MSQQRVALVLASTDRGPAVEASLDGFLRQVEERGEVIVVDTTGRDIPVGFRVLRRPAGRLVPELWGDGLHAADAELVAFSTTQMVPRAGWLDALLAGIGSGCGVGGPIEAGEGISIVDRAVFLLRFLAYGRDLPARPSGENALYRRDRLIEVEELWDEGFWESEVHRCLESLGGDWSMAPGAVIDYCGSTGFGEIAAQRLAHARRFGAVRSEGWPAWRKLLRSAAAPAIPPLMLARTTLKVRRRGLGVRPWLTCLPTFVMLATLWAWGEAIGTLLGLESAGGHWAGSLTNGLTD